jgi:signal transduction histidine kinase
MLLGVVALTGALQLAFERRALQAEQSSRQAGKAQELARVCEQAVLESNEDYLADFASTLKQAEPLAYVVLSDEKGSVLFKAGREEGAAPGAVQYALPIEPRGWRAGEVRVGFERAANAAAIDAVMSPSRRRLAAVSAVAVAAGLLGAFLLAASFTRPIRSLARAARAVAGGDFRSRVPVHSGDELGELAEEFNHMAGRLGEIDEMKQSFMETITHDLRNPLVAVRGYIDLVLEDEKISSAVRTKLETALRGADRLNALIEDILGISKLEAGKLLFDLEPGDIGAIVCDVAQTMGVVAEKYGIKLTADVAPGLPPVRMDADQIHRVLTNLVGNALKFTPDGGAVAVTADRDKDGVKLSVRDTGAGIPADKIGRLFSKFYQVEETREAARSRGTGLGLTICTGIVEGHGGKIWVESELGRGSTFLFTLPAPMPKDARA